MSRFGTPRQPLYTGFCRFTSRPVEVFPHGHGVKVTLRNNEGEATSVFLDAGDVEDLAHALAGVVGTGVPSAARMERLVSALSDALLLATGSER